MVYPSEQPPTPKAMSDSDLNSKVAELQSQPGGLEAAMALIEEQTKLRQEDALALASWQLEDQMRRTSELSAPANPDEAEPTGQDAISELEPVALNAEPTMFPESQPAVQVDVPKPVPHENVDQIVASLNASYAKLAAEGSEEVESEVSTPSQQGDYSEGDLEPEPVSAAVEIVEKAAAEDQTESFEETVLVTETVRPTEQPASLVWSWLALSSTPVLLVLTALVVASGASIAQSALLLAGSIFVVSLLSAIGAVAAKRASSSLPVVSRAAFGVWGNALPTFVMVLAKVFWLGALLVFASRTISPLVANQPWFAGLSSRFIFEPDFLATALVAVMIVIIASVIAGLGGLTILRSQQLSAVISLVAIFAFSFFVFSEHSISSLRVADDANLPSLLDLALLVVSIFGFAVISQSGDFARKLPIETPGSKVFFLSFVSTFFLPLAISMLCLAWLFMTDEEIALGVLVSTLPTMASATPIWIFVLFIVGLGISLIQLVSHSAYSVSTSLYSLGVRVKGMWQQLIIAILVLGLTLTASYLIPVSTVLDLLNEGMYLVSVVAAAWLGILLSDALIRKTGYHEVSLNREYGFYGKFNWVNLVAFLIASGVGYGYLAPSGLLLSWTGYLGVLTPGFFDQLGSLLGILMSFGLALLSPVLFGIFRIRKQELSHLELEQRRLELKEFLDTVD